MEISSLYPFFICSIRKFCNLLCNERLSEKIIIQEQIVYYSALSIIQITMTLKKFIYRTLLFSTVILAIAIGLFSTVLSKYYLQIFPFLLIFFVSLTIGVHFILLKAGKQRPAKFSAFYMGSITSKLFIYMIFMVIYILADKPNAVVFLITFFVLYICYTVFETYFLLKDFREMKS